MRLENLINNIQDRNLQNILTLEYFSFCKIVFLLVLDLLVHITTQAVKKVNRDFSDAVYSKTSELFL